MNTYTVHNMLQTCVVIKFMRDYDAIQTALAKYVVCMYVGITFSL